jgi:hypothetical protein
MNTSEPPDFFAEPKPSAEEARLVTRVAELEGRVQSQRFHLQVTLGLLLLLAAVVNVFLYQQIRTVHAQSRALDQSVKEMKVAITDYETNTLPWIQRFAVETTRFAAGHADFRPVFEKYDLAGANNKPAPAPARVAAPPKKP